MTKRKLDKYGNDHETEGLSDIYIFFPISDLLMEPMYRLGLKPNHITLLSTIFTLVAGYFYVNNYIELAIIFYLLGYVMDCMDGRMARKYNMGSTLGMMLDGVSDIVTNVPIFTIITIKTLCAIKMGVHAKRKTIAYLIFLLITYAFSVVFGINEAIESYHKTKDDNFYLQKKKILKKENYDNTVLGKMYCLINKQAYKSYRKMFPEKINEKNIKSIKGKLLKLKEFGPGNYNLLIAIMMYLI